MNRPLGKTDVLTLAEAARYLRVKPAKLLAMAEARKVPSRLVEGEWRFLQSALENWLCGEEDPTQALLQQAGTWCDDETVADLLRDIYKARGRPQDGELAR